MTEIDLDQAMDALSLLSRGHSVSDEAFDRIFSKETRALSSRHWTPMNVALWAARALGSSPGSKVLDVGSGPGKFCFIGAATTPAFYVGIEQRSNFVLEAEKIRKGHAMTNLAFINGNMIDLDWKQFQAFYLYNPFLENVTRLARIDQQVPLSLDHFNQYVEVVEEKLSALPSGTRVMTYHGYGGAFPSGYFKAERKAIGTNYLELWIRE